MAISPACPKCGSMKKSGERSCCARGGSWFQECGDAGDPRFAHTWTEGMQACKCKHSILFPLRVSSPNVQTLGAPTPRITTAISSECPKCGSMKKSGERSCCARGGSWFQECGDVGDTRFVHTWIEGMQACECKMNKYNDTPK